MDFGVFEIFQLIGSLGFFIYGMKIMSEGIQKVAGAQLRSILGAMTTNRVAGVGTGLLTTSLIQSSSATTVMVVSFVNAGLLNLRQSIGVIMGANIGTTMTAWLIALLGFSKFSLSSYAIPILAVAVPMLFFKRAQVKNLGEFLVGFALLFLGLDFLKDTVSALELDQNEAFIGWVNSMASQGILAKLLFVLIGTVITVIVQSSSAAMALTLTFIGSGLPFELAAAIVLGENIGTTITANLAALIGNVHAKRAARAHTIFNLIGVIWMLLIFGWFLTLISDATESLMTANTELAVANRDRYALALFHTVFNIINTFFLIWFVDLIANTVIRLVPSKGEEDEQFHLEYIGSGMMGTPELSLLEAKKEVVKFGLQTKKMMGFLRKLVTETDKKKFNKLMERIQKYEEITDRMDVEVSDYLLKVSAGELSENASLRVRSMLSITDDLETIGDVIFQVSKGLERKRKDKIWFTPEQRNNVLEMITLLEEAFDVMINNLELDYSKVETEEAYDVEDQINKLRSKLRKQHLKSVEKRDYNIRSGLIYTDLFNSCEKIGDHVFNVTSAAAGSV